MIFDEQKKPFLKELLVDTAASTNAISEIYADFHAYTIRPLSKRKDYIGAGSEKLDVIGEVAIRCHWVETPNYMMKWPFLVIKNLPEDMIIGFRAANHTEP
ncbi:hypothetical protein B0A49_13368, partial [Cryomyces minteri]